MPAELGGSQISSLLESLPGIASVLRSPVADALVRAIRAAAGIGEFEPEDAEELVRYAVRVHRGFPTNDPLLYDSLCRRFAIRFARPAYYMLDGEVLGPADRLEVDVYRRLTFVRE